MSQALRAIIVDDEQPAREGLASDLTTIGVTVVASCANARDAARMVREQQADVIFVDVEMPEIDGFALLESLEPEDVPPAIVFVTAYDQHALRAFDAQALDYVLKPFSVDRLRVAVERADRRVREARALANQLDRNESNLERSDAERYGSRLVIRERNGSIVVPVSDIDWIEAETYYVRLHLANGKSRLMRERMAVLEARLDPSIFFRTHRSAIVRLERVRSVKSASRYEHSVTLTGGTVVPLSRERRARLVALLGDER